MSHKHLQLLCYAAAFCCFGYFLYSYYNDHKGSINILAITAALLLVPYRFSLGYKIKNSLRNLIERREDELVIARLRTAPFSKKSALVAIKVSRISVITINDNYLSVIIDGNGKGYDFQLLATTDEISERLHALLTHDERAAIEINVLKN